MIIGRKLDGKDVPKMIIDQFDEMLEQLRRRAPVMGIAQARDQGLIEVASA